MITYLAVINPLSPTLIAFRFRSVPILITKSFERQGLLDDAPLELLQNRMYITFQGATVSFGLLLAVIYCLQLVISGVITIHKRFISEVRHIEGVTALEEFVKRIFTASNVRGTMRLKRAGTRKINKMLHNALTLHRRAELHVEDHLVQIKEDLTFANFLLYGESTTLAGSFVWSWRQILSGRLFDEEGIWLPSRLVVFQVVQVLFASVAIYFLYERVEIVAAEADKSRESLPPNLPQWIYDISPTGDQVRLALYPACFTGAAVMGVIILLYIPRYAL
jgi:hypothetical protein